MKSKFLNIKIKLLVGALLCISTPIIAGSLTFTDVESESYYEEAVNWAVENGITGGTTETTFEPDTVCTRGQVVTFLYRAKGSVEPTSTNNNFVDVNPDDYYYKAVLWAIQEGITGGTSSTTFSPDETCTAGQVITFLWRANGSIGETSEGEYYTDAVKWAKQNGLLEEMGKEFNPNNLSPRKDIVTYLFRNSHSDGSSEEVVKDEEVNRPYGYYGNILTEGEKKAYNAIIKAALNFQIEVNVDGYGIHPDRVVNLIRCVINDNPDIYWLEGGCKYWHDDNGNVLKVALNYNSTKDEVYNLKSTLEENTQRLLNGVDSKTSDIDKIKQIHDNIVKSTYYSLEGNNIRDIRGVMIEGRGVCESYAETTKYLLDKIGVQSILVSGNTKGGAHEWNLVLIDGEWKALDTTWDDPIPYAGKSLPEDYVRYDYFLIPIQEIMTMERGRTYDDWCNEFLPK